MIVQNMTCPTCPYIVEKSLAAVPGVTNVEVSFENKTANVTFNDSQTNVAALTSATRERWIPITVCCPVWPSVKEIKEWNCARSSLVRTAIGKKPRSCLGMPVSTSMTARAVARFCDRSWETAACSAPMAQCRARPFRTRAPMKNPDTVAGLQPLLHDGSAIRPHRHWNRNSSSGCVRPLPSRRLEPGCHRLQAFWGHVRLAGLRSKEDSRWRILGR